MPNRIATEEDALNIHSCNVGDFIIDPDNQPGDYKSVYLRSDWGWLNGENPPLGPGSKILINAEHIYTMIDLYMGVFSGAIDNRIIITQYNGQLRVMPQSPSDVARRFSVHGAKHVKVTFEYEEGVSGDPNYLGCQNGWHSFPSGKFGAYISGEWMQYCSLFSAGKDIFQPAPISWATDIEVKGMEICNGGFAGLRMWNDNEDDSFMNIKISNCYVHDTDSEGAYIGKNETEGRIRLHAFNNLFIRTGTEVFQGNNLCEDSIIENNAFINSSVAYKDPFYVYQVGGVQTHTRFGKQFFRNNIVIGTFASPIAHFGGYKEENGIDIDAEFKHPDDAITFTNNYYAQVINGTTYLNRSGDIVPDPDLVQDFIFEKNFVYAKKPDGNSEPYFFRYNSSAAKYRIIIRENRYEQGDGGIDLAVSGPLIEEYDNIKQDIVPISFIRDGLTEKGFTWWDLKMWGVFDYWIAPRGDTDIPEKEGINTSELTIGQTISVKARYNRYTGTLNIGDELAFIEIPGFIDHRVLLLESQDVENYFFGEILDISIGEPHEGNFDYIDFSLSVTKFGGNGSVATDFKFTKRSSVAEYETGELLVHKSKFYVANENTMFQSPDNFPEKYTQIFWQNGNELSELPPDNYNLTNNMYKELGMGLLAQIHQAPERDGSKKTLLALNIL